MGIYYIRLKNVDFILVLWGELLGILEYVYLGGINIYLLVKKKVIIFC